MVSRTTLRPWLAGTEGMDPAVYVFRFDPKFLSLLLAVLSQAPAFLKHVFDAHWVCGLFGLGFLNNVSEPSLLVSIQLNLL